MLESFHPFEVSTTGGVVAGVAAGSGPAVLLLHGIPQTHRMWRSVVPYLIDEYTIVATDLRGYGGSGFPPTDARADPRRHSMRSLAADQVAVMNALGHNDFAVVGHDRGARCGFRMALDHPDCVRGLAVLDIIPTGDAFAAADRDFALGYWVWSFLAAPWPVPERLIAGNPDVFVDHMLDAWSDTPGVFTTADREAYRAQFRNPDRVHAICEQYRAAATADIADDEADRGRQLGCPVLAMWSATGAVGSWYDPLAVWRRWATDVTGVPIAAGHFLAEEAPLEVVDHLTPFLNGLSKRQEGS